MVDNATAAGLYRNAKIGLNLHRTSMGWGKNTAKIERADSLNPRAYELTACGVFQVSDWRAEVEEVFGIGIVPTFENATELERLIRANLTNDGIRERKAKMAMERVQGHTFAARAERIMSDLQRATRPALTDDAMSTINQFRTKGVRLCAQSTVEERA